MPETRKMRIVLDQENFAALVRGLVVSFPGVDLVLADIGFDEMTLEVLRAERDQRGNSPEGGR